MFVFCTFSPPEPQKEATVTNLPMLHVISVFIYPKPILLKQNF